MHVVNYLGEASSPRTDSSFRILDAGLPKDYEAWDQLWQRWPEREVFAHPGYVSLFKSDTDRALCAAYESPAGCALYPFLLKDLSRERYCAAADGPAADITAPIGYGGPVGWDITDRQRLTTEFWGAFDSWCVKSHVVTEFARLSLDGEQLIDQRSERIFRQNNVVRSLEPSEAELWQDFRHKVRKNVNRARQSGLHIEVDLTGTRIDDFAQIYSATMNRRQASEAFRFSHDFFDQIHLQLAGKFAYFHTCLGTQVVSTELVLLSANRVYSWLGGTDIHFYELRPNDLLKFEIMLWAKAQGKHSFILGGGASPQDGIFRYKQSFAPSGVLPFFTRRRIVDAQRYRLLVERASGQRSKSPLAGVEDFFPAYRAA
jgi:hypothetical protein